MDFNALSYKYMIETEKDIIFIINDNNIFLDVYTNISSNLLYNIDYFIGKRLEDIFNKEISKKFNYLKKHILDKKQTGIMKYEIFSDGQSSLFLAEILKKNSKNGENHYVILSRPYDRSVNKTAHEPKFYDLSENLICTIDKKNLIIRVNEEWENLFNYRKEDIVASNFFKIVADDYLKQTREAAVYLRENKVIKNFINKIKDKDGDLYYIEWNGIYKNGNSYLIGKDVSERIKTEKKLRDSDKNFRNFFEKIDDFVFVSNYNGELIYVNSPVIEKLGYSLEEISRMHILDFHFRSDYNEARIIFDEMINKDRKICPLPLKDKYGNLVTVETKGWKGKWNNKDAFFAISKDLTSEQESLQKFNKIFKNNPALMVIISVDSNKIVEVNDRFLEVLGYAYDEVVNSKSMLENIFHGENRENIKKTILKNGSVKDKKVKIKKKNGQIIEGLFFGEVIRSQGKVYILKVILDVTKQNEAVRKLEHNSQLQKILMDISTDYINQPLEKVKSSINKALKIMGEFIDADRVYIFDYDYKKQTTSNIFEWCNTGIEPQINELQDIPLEIIESWVNKHIKGKEIIIEDVENYSENDSVKEILQSQDIKSVITVPMMKDGKCIGYIGFDSVKNHKKYTEDEVKLLKLFAQILVNINNREEQELKIKKSLEEKLILIKEIHHRVKNNLQLISSLLYLQGSYEKDEKYKELLAESESRVKSMAVLYDKIHQNENVNKINLGEYIRSINLGLKGQYDFNDNINLIDEIENIQFDIDKAILCGLIVNELVTNAFKYAFSDQINKKITVKILKQADNIRISVSDNGKGIKGNLEEVSKKSLGLSLVQNLTRQLEGSIKMENNQGTTFKIKLEI